MNWLFRNWGMKLVSLFLAIGLWYYAVGEEEMTYTRLVPLEIKVENPQLSILKVYAENLEVTLTAPRALFSEIVSEKIFAVHVIGKEVQTAGDYSFRVEPYEIKVPNTQIRIAKIEPAVIGVTLDEVITKKLKVTPSFLGEPAFGYKVVQEEIQMDPNAVLVEGPRGQLEKMESVETEKIDLVGRIRAFRRTVALDLPDNVRSLNEAPIDIYIPIHEEVAEKNYEKIPVRILRLSASGEVSKIEPAEVSFALKGSIKQLENLSPEKVVVYADVSSLSDGEQTVPVRFILPENVSLKDDQPVLVKVTLKKK